MPKPPQPYSPDSAPDTPNAHRRAPIPQRHSTHPSHHHPQPSPTHPGPLLQNPSLATTHQHSPNTGIKPAPKRHVSLSLSLSAKTSASLPNPPQADRTPAQEAFSAPSCAQHITKTAESINKPKFRSIKQSNTPCLRSAKTPDSPDTRLTTQKPPHPLSPASRWHHHSALAPTSRISTLYRAGINTYTKHPSRAPSGINRAPSGDQLHTPWPLPSPHSYPNSQPQSNPPTSSNPPQNLPTVPLICTNHTQGHHPLPHTHTNNLTAIPASGTPPSPSMAPRTSVTHPTPATCNTLTATSDGPAALPLPICLTATSTPRSATPLTATELPSLANH